MRIVHVVFQMCVGGMESMLVDIMNSQVDSGHSVSLVIVNSGSSLDSLPEIDRRVSVTFLNRSEGSRNPFFLLKLNRILRGMKPDVVHTHDEKMLGMIFRRRGVRYVFTAHQIGLEIKRSRKADIICAVSRAVSDDLSIRERICSEVVVNGIVSSSIKKRKKEMFDPGQIVIGCVARLDHNVKGQDILLDAFAKLNIKGARLEFFGDGVSSEYLRQKSVELGIQDSVTFYGKCDREFIYENIACCDIMVQPSRSEGFGLTVAESFAAGVPVVVSDLPALVEIIDGGKYGYTFVAGDSSDLAGKIKYVLANYSEALEKADEAQKTVAKRFDVSRTARQYIGIYS